MRALRNAIVLMSVLGFSLSFYGCSQTDSASTAGTTDAVTLSQPDIKCGGVDCIQ